MEDETRAAEGHCVNTEEEGMEKPGNVMSSTMGLAENTDDIVTLCISVSNLLGNVSLSQ